MNYPTLKRSTRERIRNVYAWVGFIAILGALPTAIGLLAWIIVK